MQKDNPVAKSSDGSGPNKVNHDLTVDSQTENSWEEIYAALDAAGFPPEFMAHRDQGTFEHRDHDNDQ